LPSASGFIVSTEKTGRQTNEVDTSIHWSISCNPTVEIQKGPKSKPFVVHIDKVKPFTGTPPTNWIASSSEIADVSDVVGHHVGTAETEETESAGPRLRRRLENGPTSSSALTEVYDADKQPVRARPPRTIRRPKRFDYSQGSGYELDNATSDEKGSPRLPTLLANDCLLDMMKVELAPTFNNADESCRNKDHQKITEDGNIITDNNLRATACIEMRSDSSPLQKARADATVTDGYPSSTHRPDPSGDCRPPVSFDNTDVTATDDDGTIFLSFA